MSAKRVLVVGAGPVGLTTALALARAHSGTTMRVHVFERRDTPNQTSLASTFHSPTIAMLEDLGAAGGLLAHDIDAAVDGGNGFLRAHSGVV